VDRAQTRLLAILAVLVAVVAAFLYLQGPETAPRDPDATATVWDLGEEDAIVAITLERESDTIKLVDSDDGWHLVTPLPPGRADEERAAALARALGSLSRGVPVEAPAERAGEFGLGDPPAARVTVETSSGRSLVLDVGNEAPVGYRTYVRGEDGSIVAASGDLHRQVTEDAPSFRDHRVFHFAPGDVQELSIASVDTTVALTREGGRWWVDGLGPADAARVDDLIGSLLDIRFDTITGADGGASDPVYTVEVLLAGGGRQSLRTGMPSGEEVEAVAADGRIGSIYEGLLRELGRRPEDLATETAFQIGLETTDEIVVVAGGRSIRATRDGPAWNIEGTEDGAAYDAVAALAAVPVIGWVEGEPGAVAAQPDATVTVRAGEASWTVRVGGEIAPGETAAHYGRGRPARIPADGVRKFLEAIPRGASSER
jgi:hypothetical protein